MSSAYSGVGTVEQASHQICTGLTAMPSAGRIMVTHMWALEKDATCKAELVSWFAGLGHVQTCVFGNLKDFVDERWHSDLGFGKHAVELKPAELFAKGLHNSDVHTHSTSCAAHTGPGRHRLCHLPHTDVHVAGTTCVDHSTYGKCSGDEGKNVKFFLIWASMMKKLQPKIILHENVAGFGTTALSEVLGSLYVICPSVSCSSYMGYPIRRRRQMCILVLKTWIYRQLHQAGMSTFCNPHDVIKLVDLQGTLDLISQRPCHLTWSDFMITGDDSNAATEVAEARARPSVEERWTLAAGGHTEGPDKNGNMCNLFPGDVGSPVLESLLPRERQRVELVVHQVVDGGPRFDVIDVSQNPDERARMIKHGATTFMTVIAGSGLLLRLDTMRANPIETRLVTATDILAMSGFPITADHVEAAGCACMFSNSRTAPRERTARSMKKQVGNAMHFTHVGLVFLSAVIKFPRLGSIAAITNAAGVKREAEAAAESGEAPSPPARSEPGPSSGLLRACRARRNLT